MPLFLAPLPAPPSFQAERSPRLRRILSNGAVAFSESRPGERRVRAAAFLAQPELESEADEGRRHLLEHLVAGRDPRLDAALEAVGGGFGASTERDGMRFWVEAPAGQEELAMGTLSALLRPIKPDPAAIAREVRLIGRERSLLGRAELASIAAWTAIYGEAGRGPMGNERDLESASADELAGRWARMLLGRRLVVGVSGPEDVDVLNERARKIAVRFAAGPEIPWAARKTASDRSTSPGAYALPVGPVGEARTLARLGVALAIAGEVDGTSVVYTPSNRNGMILIENGPAAAELAKAVRRPSAGAYARPGTMLARWIEGRREDPALSLETRLTLYAASPTLTLERVQEVAAGMGRPEMDRAFAEWAEAAK